MDYDVIVIGSGFGGAITGCRLAEAGKRVLILERGREWTYQEKQRNSFPRADADIDRWMWDHNHPELLNGWFELRVFPTMTVAQGAGVGGGSLVYANVSIEAPPAVFDRGWPPEITYPILKPYYDRVAKFMKVQPLPRNQWNGRTLLMEAAAKAIGVPQRFRTVDLAINFDPNLKLDLANPPPWPAPCTNFPINDQGVPQGTCFHCGYCDIGCPSNARNTLDTNYLPKATKKHGAEIRPLHLVTNIEPVAGGYRVSFDKLGDGTRTPGSQTARLVIVAAESLGSTELLLRCRDVTRSLPGLSPFLGRNWSSNGDFLTPALYGNRGVYPSLGPTIASVIDFQDGSVGGHPFWIQDGGFPDLLAKYVNATGLTSFKALGTWFLMDALRFMLKHCPSQHVMPWFAQGVDAGDGVLSLRRPWWFFGRKRLHLKWNARNSPVFDAIVAMHERLSHQTGRTPLVPPSWTLARALITPHPLGGCNMGTDRTTGVVDHRGEVFGHPGLYVADGAIVPRAVGVNPSRTIAALAERIAEIMIAEKR
jgi:cholesterol oxidase